MKYSESDLIGEYKITTGMGRCFTRMGFITVKQQIEFNLIGYSGKNSVGKKTNYNEYLNSLNIGYFNVICTKYDNGNYSEYYIIKHYNDKYRSEKINNILKKIQYGDE